MRIDEKWHEKRFDSAAYTTGFDVMFSCLDGKATDIDLTSRTTTYVHNPPILITFYGNTRR
jgi:hypothetical protein